MLIYISGNTEKEKWQDDFEKAELWLRLNGMKPINSGKIVSSLPAMTYEQYMQINYKLIDMSDYIFMLDGWQKSKTACAEINYAKSLGKFIKYQDYYKEFRRREIENDK